jgi:hypothetical protein
MRRFGSSLVLLTTMCVCASACQRSAALQKPTVTAKGSAGEEDVPDLAITQVTLKAGDTLLISCDDEGGDVEIAWNGTSLHRDAVTRGAGFYTAIFTLYSATGGVGDIVASHVSGGDLTMNAYTVTNLAPSALDKTAFTQGLSTSPSSGATAATSHANEFLWGVIGYATNPRPTGTWADGFASGGQFKDTGGISGVEDGYKTVSSTGAYAAAKTGIDKGAWTAVIVTYATATGR